MMETMEEIEFIEEDANRKTSMSDGHWHLAEVNYIGTGNTTATFPVDTHPHFHKILNNSVQDYEGHTHELLSLIDPPKESVEEPIKEDVEINIKELGFQEKIFTLNTGREKLAYNTVKINGELKSVLIDSDKVINVLIRFKDYNGITIFSALNFGGQKYFNIRKAAVGESPGDIFEEGAECWILNDEIDFIIEGNIETTTKFVVRYK